jgi:DNA primase
VGRIPEETLQAIRDRVDLVGLVGRHVALKKAGRSWKGLCPFHHEKTPSFTVNPDRGIFHCFGCGESGNALTFLMRVENLTFPEAVRTLAAECGVEVPESAQGGGEAGLVERLLEANAVAQRLYRSALASEAGKGARAYLAQRGLGAPDVERFGIGLAPDSWDELERALRRAGVPAAIGERAGLLRERPSGGHYDLLRGRVTFPIQDARGRVVAFGGRALAADQEPKYLNSPESPLFRKREAFYGLPHALDGIRRSDRIVVVEGYFDRIALHRAGLEEALATCGTALSEDHARSLRRRARQVVLLFDGDAAGRRAALRALDVLLPSGLRVRAASLPAGDDPDTLLAREGAEALRAIVEQAPAGLDLAIADAVAGGCATPEQKADAVGAVVPLLARIADPTERSAWAQRPALAAGTRDADVLASVRAAARGGEPAEPAAPAAPRLASPEDRQLAQLVQALLDHPGCGAQIDPLLLEVIEDPAWRELVAALREASGSQAAGSLMAWLEARLGDAALARLHEATEAPGCDASAAAKVVEQTVKRLLANDLRRRKHELTQQLRQAAPEQASPLIERKQKLIEAR